VSVPTVLPLASLDEWAALCVDLGTGGPKIALVTLDGTVHWSEFRPVETERPTAGRALQDAEVWWREIIDAARGALDAGVVPRAWVRAIAVTGQWSSTVPVRADLTPAGPCRLWLDTSAAAHSRRVVGGPVLGYDPRRLGPWLRRTAGIPSPFGGDPVSHMLGFRHDEPALHAETAFHMEPVDHLTSRFAGRVCASAASMSGAWLVDVRGDRSGYDPDLVRLAGVDPDRLPPLLPSGSVVGPVDADVAADLGLSPDVAVVAGTPDLHSAWVGSGALDHGRAHVSISTTSWISCAVPFKKTDPLHSIATVPGLVPGEYLVADNHEAAGASMAWLAHEVLGEDYATLCALAATSPAGSNGVVFAPWLAGMRSPVDDRRARAAWLGMDLSTSRADLVRAVLEGVALQSRWLLGPVEKFAGTRFDALRILGGGAQSDLWCQIHADALGRRIERVADPMTAQLRGAALLAGVALRAIGWADVPALVPVDRTFIPDPQAERVYARLAAELPKAYSGLKGVFARLHG
jgi:xylulokinase